MRKYFKNHPIISEFYLDRYLRFMTKYSNYPKIKNKTSYHHILPRSLFPKYSNLRENDWNGIHLPKRAHYLAHWMLAKALGGKMWNALWLMGRGQGPKYSSNSFVYDELTKEKMRTPRNDKKNFQGPKSKEHVEAMKKSKNSKLYKERMREVCKGSKCYIAKKFKIFDNDGKMKFECFGDLSEVVHKNGLSPKLLEVNQRGIPLQFKRKSKFSFCEGWYIIELDL